MPGGITTFMDIMLDFGAMADELTEFKICSVLRLLACVPCSMWEQRETHLACTTWLSVLIKMILARSARSLHIVQFENKSNTVSSTLSMAHAGAELGKLESWKVCLHSSAGEA